MRQLFGVLAAFALLSLSTGCATVINGTTQKVQVASRPSGATVTVLPERTTFVTPGEVELARKKTHTLVFELACFAPATSYLDRRMSQVVHGNLILGGLIGLLVDIDSGGAFKLVPSPVHVTLEPLPAPADGASQRCPPAGGLAGAEP
jgi:hypothetical protein